MASNIRDFLGKHIEQRFANHFWVKPCLLGKTDPFPYRPDPNGHAEIATPFDPSQKSNDLVIPEDGSAPHFVVNIPMRRVPTTSLDYSNISSFFKIIRDQSFGSSSQDSADAVKQQLAVVVGVNQIRSLDPALNVNFKRFIQGLPVIHDVVSRIFGFFWKPKWTSCFGAKPKKNWELKQWELLKKRVYSVDKAFLLLKVLSPAKAEKVRKAHEQPRGIHPSIVEQVPFQRIRETIKNSKHTRNFLSQLEQDAPGSPIYYVTMDADCSDLLAGTGRGIFSRLKDLIVEKRQPSIASLGYSLSQEEAVLLRLAVKIDMAVRATMPMPYFPEPFTAYKVRRPNAPSFLNKLSFLGSGNGLESRRFIQNGRELFTDGAILRADGGVVTKAPDRMKTIYNQKVEVLSETVLKKQKTLQALRSRVIQSHAFPKQWAEIMYAALPFSCQRVTDATAPMMHIFALFDPIARMSEKDHYTSEIFDEEMQNYCDPLSAGQQNLLATARGKLYNLGMQKDLIDLVEKTARSSGAAIHTILSEILETV